MATLFYNRFESVISQVPTARRIIPALIEEAGDAEGVSAEYDYEPGEDAILQDLLPRAVATQIFTALLENGIPMDAVRQHLDSGRGLKLLHPPYRSFPRGVGSLLNYPPGLKENAAIFCHAHAWAIIAEAMLGRGDLAYRYYRQILPPQAARTSGAELYRVEPYVYCQFIFGPDPPLFGRGSHSWLTGTAAWCWCAFVQWILGLRPAWEGLFIDPCLPSDWEGYRAERIFRGACYRLEVRKPRGICKGKARIVVDGVEIPTQVIPPPAEEGGTHEVVVFLEQ